jgi:cytochrome P450
MPPEFLEFYGSMTNMDDPKHVRLRKIVSRGFTPRRLAALGDEVAATARAIVDDVIDAGRCDAVRAISARLPLKIVCDMMGVPDSQYDFVFDRTNIVLGASDPEFVPDAENIVVALLQAGNELAELMRDLGRVREQNPTDDLTSALVNAEIDGGRLTPTSSRASSSCWSWRVTRPPATPSAGACTSSPRTPCSGPSGSPTWTPSPPPRWRRSSAGRRR